MQNTFPSTERQSLVETGKGTSWSVVCVVCNIVCPGGGMDWGMEGDTGVTTPVNQPLSGPTHNMKYNKQQIKTDKQISLTMKNKVSNILLCALFSLSKLDTMKIGKLTFFVHKKIDLYIQRLLNR